MTNAFQATLGEPRAEVCPMLAWSFSPPGAGAAHLTSAPRVQLCNGHECPGNMVKQRVTFAEVHNGTAPGSVLGPRVGAGGYTAPRGSPATGAWFGTHWGSCAPVARESLRLGDESQASEN